MRSKYTRISLFTPEGVVDWEIPFDTKIKYTNGGVLFSYKSKEMFISGTFIVEEL